jgi:hypothetical protein
MPKKVAILQPNYIPWKGYFDLINMVDEFVIFDEVQYTKKDWRNRNLIKTPQGLHWLTIPVTVKHQQQKIYEVNVANQQWREKHWRTLCINYAKTRYLTTYSPVFEELYLRTDTENLRDILVEFIKTINTILGIDTKLTLSTAIPQTTDNRLERIREILLHTQAELFINGPKAKSFMSGDAFAADGITIQWMNYEGYVPYGQVHPPFEHGVIILDLIFNQGPEAQRYMKSFGHHH